MSNRIKYKPTNLAWCPEIPEHWEVKKIKYTTTINDDVIPENTDEDYLLNYVEIGDVSHSEGLRGYTEYLFKNAPSRARRKVKDGDVIVSTVRTYLKAIANIKRPPENLIVSTGFAVLRPFDINPEFLSFSALTNGFIDETIANSVGVSYPAINSSEIGNIKIPFPPLPEQHRIAAYLDEKTSLIDDLISKKQLLIERLKEERTAIINQAVTKGIDPNAEMKDSGVEWIGEIPKDWEVKKLKYVVSINDEVLNDSEDENREIEYVEISDVNYIDGIMGTTNIPLKNAPSRAKRIVRKGDVIISTVRTYLKAIAQIKQNRDNLIVSTGFAVLRPNKINPDFLGFIVLSNYFISNTIANSVGVSYPAINSSQLGEFYIAFPKEMVQCQIADAIIFQTTQIDKSIAIIQKGIEFLKEYKSALINEVVTGKKIIQ